ncbi:Dynactin subunit 3 [Pitangus sulphuratus]|nr:Dynactin subunit 3 [Pitangus sulphuratus]
MAAGAAELQRLRWRLEELERRVGLGGGGSGPRKVADELVKVQVALNNIAGKRERIKILFKKLEDVIKYLDPQYIDRMAVPDAMKLQFILAEEQAIPERAALLEQVKNLQPILDSASIQAVPDHAAKLQRLSQIHIQQQEKRHDLTDSVKTLLEGYNKMVSFDPSGQADPVPELPLLSGALGSPALDLTSSALLDVVAPLSL